MSSSIVAKSDLLHLYKRLLRGCQKYPSKNRDKIFQSVKEDFRENMVLDPSCEYSLYNTYSLLINSAIGCVENNKKYYGIRVNHHRRHSSIINNLLTNNIMPLFYSEFHMIPHSRKSEATSQCCL